MPALLLLMKENATVTVCHSRTKNIDEVVRRADIVIAAIGVPQFVRIFFQPHLAIFFFSVYLIFFGFGGFYSSHLIRLKRNG